jgi:hypothetical protein
METVNFTAQEIILPKQLDKSEAAFVTAMADAFDASLRFFFTSNFVITAFTSVVMYYLWGMINGL